MANEFIARNGIIALSNSTITGSLDVMGNLTTTGTITAQKLVVQQVTSSIVYSSGSNVFGNSLSNTQTLTGSVAITGSLSVNGTSSVAGSGTTNYVPKFTSANVIGNSQVFDNGTNIGIGTTSLGASPNNKTLGFTNGSNIQARTAVPQMAFSSNIDGDWFNATYKTSNFATQFYLDSNAGTIALRTASSGSAGNAITWNTPAIFITNNSNVLIGTTTDAGFKLDVNGTTRVTGQLTLGSTITNGTFTYTLPSATGTLALTSQLTGGTVTSVGLSSATSGVTIGSSPITTSGTITLAIATASGSQQGLLSSTDWTTFNGKQNAITLTTTGSSGAATLISNTLNIPNYTLAGLGGQPLDADLTSIAGLAGTTGLLRKTAANTFTLDTTAYITLADARTGLSFVSGSGAYNNTTGVITIPTNTNQLTNGAGFTTNTGTVTSVGGTGTVSGLTLSGTVTTSGNLTLGGTLSVAASNFSSQIANTFLAAPNGVAGVPTFRTIVASDIPTLNQNTTGTAANVTGTVAIANGGTGGTTAAAARTNLGATTIGNNIFIATNPGVISFLRANADNTVSFLDAASFRTAIGAGTSSTTGTVTSVGGTGTVSGLTLTGTVTTTGNLTLGGTLSVAASNFASQTANTVLAAPNGVAGVPTFRALVAADIPTLNQNTTGTAANVTGTVAIANGGTGATTAAAARTNLGATTLGGNLFTLANVAVISFPRFNADNTVSSLDAATFRTAIGAGTSSTTGTVTSVGGTGTVSGLTLTGTVTTTGNLTLGGTLSVIPSNFASQTANTILAAPSGAAGVPTFRALVAADIPTLNQNTTGNAGTATILQTARTIGGVSFNGSANINLPGVNTAGNQNTTGTAANVTGTVAIANGGTGATTAAAARTNLGATTVGSNIFIATNPGAISFLRANADNTVSFLDAASFRTAIGAGTSSTTGTVTSVGGTGTVSGLTLSGTVTTTGNLTLGGTLSVAASNFASQTANTVLAAPSGAAGVPTFRVLAAADIPDLTLEKIPDAWIKRSVRVATTANITLSAVQTIDGIAVIAGDRVLVKDQTTASQNGIYVVAAAAWARSNDANTSAEIASAHVGVDSGTVNGGLSFDTDFKSTDTLGTTAMTWSRNVDVAYFTTVGNNFATLANPSAITFPRINANNTVSALNAADFRTAIGAGTSSTVGTVTSVGGTGTVSGLTLTGTVTTSGNLTLGGTLSVAASNFASQTTKTFLAAPNAANGVPTFRTIVASDVPTLNQSTTGNATTATTLQTARAINGTSFNGSADITTTNWGTARTITIGSTGKSINGSANVSYSLVEIGAVANIQGVQGAWTGTQAAYDAIGTKSSTTIYFIQ